MKSVREEDFKLSVGEPVKLPSKGYVIAMSVAAEPEDLARVNSVTYVIEPHGKKVSSKDATSCFLADIELDGWKRKRLRARIALKGGKYLDCIVRLVDREQAARFQDVGNELPPSKRNEHGEKRFQVALSFPGERRQFVKEVARFLIKVFGKDKVFYDGNFKAELARTDLDTYLQKIYHDDSELIVVFLCAEYNKKEWCGLEWRAIRDLIKKRANNIMPVRFDNTSVQGLFSIDGYLSINDRKPKEIAEHIIERYRINPK